jgi:hypothetical protein
VQSLRYQERGGYGTGYVRHHNGRDLDTGRVSGHLLLVWLHIPRGKRGKCEVWCQGEDHSCKRRVRHFPHEESGEEASAIL